MNRRHNFAVPGTFSLVLLPWAVLADDPVAVEIPQYKVGDVWQWDMKLPVKCERWEGHGTRDGFLVGQCGDIFLYATTQDCNWVRFVSKGGEVLAEFTPYLPFWKFPLEVGKSWEEHYKGYVKDGNRRWTSIYKARVVAYEDVTTKLGTHKAFRIEYEDHWTSGSYSGVNKGAQWYSHELKMAIKNDNRGEPLWNYELLNLQTQ
jgi:hypothetical protein